MIIDCAAYDHGVRRPGPRGDGHLAIAEAGVAAAEPDTLVWLGLYEPTDDELAATAAAFRLTDHEIADLRAPCTRPLLVHDETHVAASMRTARLRAKEDVDFGTVNLLARSSFVVVVRQGEASEMRTVRARLESRPDFLANGVGAVLYGVLDHVVDDWSPVLHELDDEVDDVERIVFSDSRADDPTQRIYGLKRFVLELHRAALPLIEPLDQLAHGEVELVAEPVHHLFRDQHDRLLRVIEQIQDLRELLTHLLEANLTQVSIRQNEDMRKISAWAAMIAVPTLIAGIYGMNFEHMPELQWWLGYPLALGIMGACVAWLYRFFRRNGWL